MKKKLLALLLGSSLALGACGGGEDATDDTKKEPANNNETNTTETADAGDAQKIYDNKCLSCHGENLKGQVGPALDKIGSTLSKDEILNVLENGKGAMPANVVEGDEADQIAEWLANKK
ncbi:cytochrome c551 [Oikeobacillus pervagus]|nr:cytochrome c [Oikeobacillus pervagus]